MGEIFCLLPIYKINLNKMQIKFLKAGTGDSILIHHKNFNILIDGGNETRHLLMEVDMIYQRGEVIDLLIITHHDDDHINGIIELLNRLIDGHYEMPDKKHFIKKVIFNSPRLILGKIPKSDDRLLSFQQAHVVEELLIRINVDWSQYTDKSESLNYDDLKIDFLSPSEKDLEKYSESNDVYLASDFKCDWKSPLYLLEQYLTDDSQDKSVPNRSSIVVKLECEGRKVLLTGDITPDRLEHIVNKLMEENGGNAYAFDHIKLPHHGSYKSLNKRIIEKIACNSYIVSTNSRKYFLPNKRAILKILKHSNRKNKKQINFIFNYEDALENLNFTPKEFKDYNFSVTSNNQKYGISI
jgi:beta-lactamase superfamily II metal-dependent hydrolase